jgi:hypothetical protein
MSKKTLAFVLLSVLILTALFSWHPNLFLFWALYPGIVAQFSVSNVHGGTPAQYKIGIAVGIVVNFLVYSAAALLLRRARKPSI